MSSAVARESGDWRQDSIASATGPGAPPLVVDDDFARAHLPFVTRTLRRMGVPFSDVEDASQEVMLAALRRAHSFESGRSPRAWLFGITRLTARKMYRRAREVCMAEPPERGAAPNQEHALQAKRARSMVHRALSELPEEQRDVLILHKLEGWPMRRVAEAVGCPMPTAYSRLRLGHARMARSIRGGVLRARLAAAAAALLGLFAGHTSAAAATAAVILIAGGAIWVRGAEPREVVAPPEPQRAASTERPGRAVRTPTPAEPALLATPPRDEVQEADRQPLNATSSPASRLHTAANHPQRARSEPSADSAAQPVQEVAAVMEPESLEDGNDDDVISPPGPEELTAPPAALQTATAEAQAQAQLDALVAEGRLLRRARALATRDSAAARAALRDYDSRFPRGRLRREANQLRRQLQR